MANQTVYPFGQNGQLPSGYPIADDLVTDSAQQALSAKQGKVLNQEKVGFPENGLNRIPVHIQGNNDTLVYGRTFGLVAGRKYRVTIINPDVSVSNITTVGSDYIRFGIAYVTSASETEYLVRVMCDNLSAPLADHYDIEIPDNIELERVFFECRFNLGETLNMYISEVELNIVSDIIASGTIIGNGTSLVDFAFPISKGDYLHIDFPNGDWQTAEQTSTYLKAYVNLVDTSVSPSVTRRTLRFAYVGWTVPDYGYDFYATPGMIASYDTGVLRIRAASGVEVPFVIRRLSKDVCKPYLMDEIADSSILTANRQGSASLTFGVITDMHYRSTEISNGCNPPFAPFSPLGAIVSIKEMATRIRLDNIVCMGDSIDGRQTLADARMDASDMSEFFLRTGVPLLYAVGNHDDNRYYSQDGGDRRFTEAEIYAKYVQQVDERTTIGGAMNGCNYYRDIDRHKVRCIVLMSINFSGQYEFTSTTRTWLTGALSSMPEGYKAIVFVHVPPPPEQMWSQTSYTGGTQTKAILANNADKIICVLTGHTHLDNVYLTPYVSVNICCQKAYNSTVSGNPPGSAAPEGAWWPVREAGTYKEILWDTVVVNQEEGLISFIRVGAGVDRYIHYTPVEVAAGGTTTLTPSVVAADSWAVLDSESSLISIANGVVTVDGSATVGSRLMAKAVGASGNFEYWCIKVVAGS